MQCDSEVKPMQTVGDITAIGIAIRKRNLWIAILKKLLLHFLTKAFLGIVHFYVLLILDI